MHEIISLQFGRRSNYLATHFWNLQESYFTYSDDEQPAVDHDIHFRSGVGVDGSQTFTPRTMIYDLKGEFGTLGKYNDLYDTSRHRPVPNSLWHGNTSMQKQPVVEPSAYQTNLGQGLPTSQLTADQVRYWTDFNRVFYHPRSIVQLSDYEVNSQLAPFESWSAGQRLFDGLHKQSDLLDCDVRPLAEECDQLAAFQIFASTDDAWGGFSSNYLDILRDEYGKSSIWVWGVEDNLHGTRQTQTRRMANVALSLQAMAPQASAIIRLSSPPDNTPSSLTFDSASEWSKSALLCTAAETVALPTRLRESRGRPGSLAEFESALNNTGARKLLGLKASIVNGYASGRQVPENQSDEPQKPPTSGPEAAFDIDYSPRSSQTSSGRAPCLFGQVEIWRCMLKTLPPTKFRVGESRKQDIRAEIYPTDVPFPRLDAFPHNLFGPDKQSLGVRAALVATSETSAHLKEMGQLIGGVVDTDTRETLLNDLAELGQAYEEGWQSGSDSDGDE